MNRSALKNYAPKARLDFIRAVTDRAAFFGLAPDRTEPMQETGDVVLIGGRAFPRVVAEQRKELQERINQHGFDQVMEAMAYTWFMWRLTSGAFWRRVRGLRMQSKA